MHRRFQQIDVFGAEPFSGNPLAVVLDGTGLSDEAMQRFARWMNLSETTFILPPASPEADYAVRIFTPACELPFAGHPTLGTCHAWLAGGGRPRRADRIVQECRAGLVPIRRTDQGLAFAAPPLRRTGPVDEAFLEHLAAILRLHRSDLVDARWVDNGPGWVGVLLEDAERVLALEPDFGRSTDRLYLGVVGPYPPGSPCAFEVRAFFGEEPGIMREDPVTGSLNASLAQWLLDTGRARAPYVASQGTRLGCRGRVRIERDAEGTVWVGGATTTFIRGELAL
ncbi:PhzF family phenazine biosynthesis protein [Rhodocaloribacter litoris]|uniref:PhzF family phenazine biosynthesis protein n=1 Tax=Rhodocaloribacter litoris TaxID=2558931 RepID=UPI00141EF8CD|nr:PhzF family phenazine biosynthesis protein [Rhodocaloribacter litoris]QXD13760.1 PhzF family phenazine biosynthesis protein [Rhodocaloribacter litoris]